MSRPLSQSQLVSLTLCIIPTVASILMLVLVLTTLRTSWVLYQISYGFSKTPNRSFSINALILSSLNLTLRILRFARWLKNNETWTYLVLHVMMLPLIAMTIEICVLNRSSKNNASFDIIASMALFIDLIHSVEGAVILYQSWSASRLFTPEADSPYIDENDELVLSSHSFIEKEFRKRSGDEQFHFPPSHTEVHLG